MEETLARICAFEREIDHRISRKQMQIADAAFKTSKSRRKLRLTVSHSLGPVVTNSSTVDPPIPMCLRIEGRIDNLSSSKLSKTLQKSLSHFVRSLIIELGKSDESRSHNEEASAACGPESTNNKTAINSYINQESSTIIQLGKCESDDGIQRDMFFKGFETIEWVKTINDESGSDGFEIRRLISPADLPLRVKVVIRMDHQPERFTLSPGLAAIVVPHVDDATKPQAILAVWQYIKHHKLQESDEKKVVRCDLALQQLFGCERMSFSEIPLRLDPHLSPVRPVIMDYLVEDRGFAGLVSKSDGNEFRGSSVWDVDVEVEDSSRSKTVGNASFMTQQRELAVLEQRMADVRNAMLAASAHRELLTAFSKDPVGVMTRLIDAQCRDVARLSATDTPSMSVIDSASTYAAHTNNNCPISFDDIERAVTLFVEKKIVQRQ